MIERPDPAEYPAFYATYVDNLPPGDVLELLRAQLASTLSTLRGLDRDRERFRYAPGKWTLTQVVAHVVDIERVFALRALRFARGDRTPLPGVDENELMAQSGLERRALASVLEEYEHQRRANLALFASFEPEHLARGGTASGGQVTVRALVHHVAGHERHHLDVLRERYL